LKSSRKVCFALRIIPKFSDKNSDSSEDPKKFVIDNFKVREFGFLSKKFRFLVETFATFERKVSLFFNFYFTKLLAYIYAN